MSGNKVVPMENTALKAMALERQDAEGIEFPRHFTKEGTNPYDTVEWEERTAVIMSEKGEEIFRQDGVEVPKSWSQGRPTSLSASIFTARSDAAAGAERAPAGGAGREHDRRVGDRRGLFRFRPGRPGLSRRAGYLLLHQHAAFNSPVWFNCGIEPHPQCSACFINSVSDTMDSILSLACTEGKLFKFGSGTGTNFSPLRSSRARLSGGGTASGPVSFMKGFDAFAGVIKSGGKTRRAAKMVILDIDHPDIEEFIECKAKEEKKAWTLVASGYDSGVDGEAYSSVFFQNANNSVRVTDEFMRQVEQNGSWMTRERPSGEVVDTYAARDLMHKIAASCHACGDPGMQYDTTINRWHTCKAAGRINASNPCSEFMFLDDSACNLASFNLLKFVDREGVFDTEGFRKAVDIMITAQDIMVDNASYPTEKIDKNSREFRPLGLGYANLGALLMHNGLAYDSDEGRNYAAAITAVMTGQSYLQSARIAAKLGTFAGYPQNRDSFMDVMRAHRAAVQNVRRVACRSRSCGRPRNAGTWW